MATPTLTQSAEYSWRVQIADLQGGASGFTAVPVTVFYRSDVLSGSAIVTQVPSTPPTLTLDLIAKASSTVTVGGTTYTYGQAFQIMAAIFAQERAAQVSS